MGVGAAAVIDDSVGRVLLVQRGPGQSGARLWCLPCGYVEWGEDVREAVAREALEEASVAVEIGDVVQVAVNRHDADRPTVGISFAAGLVGSHAEPQSGDDVAVGRFDPASSSAAGFPDRRIGTRGARRATLGLAAPCSGGYSWSAPRVPAG
jgi:ADP-ribose pyrophosphatase YjhB (NUDIX family)